MFALVDGKLVYTLGGKRTNYQWLHEDYGVSKQDYNFTVRGYIKDTRINVYRGNCLQPVNDTTTLDCVMYHLEELLRSLRVRGVFYVYDGITTGSAWGADTYYGLIDLH